MYFLSKNMCFLRIMSKIRAKPKQSGPADDFSGVFTSCDHPAESRAIRPPLPGRIKEKARRRTEPRDAPRIRPAFPPLKKEAMQSLISL